VRIVGIGGGLEYGQNGLSHYGLEDVAVMRAQPAISIIAPADHRQTRRALTATWNLPGPIYYRLGKDDKTTVPGLDGRFELSKVQRIGEGPDLLMISMGSVSNEAAAAATELEKQGVRCTLAILASVNPAPVEELAGLLAKHSTVVTVEAHYKTGGAGSLVAELIAERGIQSKLVRCAVESMPSGITGSQRYLHHRYGLSADKLVETSLKALGKSKR
jgi:transketolase